MKQEIFYNKVESQLRSDNCSDSTISLYLGGIKKFVKFSNKEDVTLINSEDLAEFSKSLFKNKNPKNFLHRVKIDKNISTKNAKYTDKHRCAQGCAQRVYFAKF